MGRQKKSTRRVIASHIRMAAATLMGDVITGRGLLTTHAAKDWGDVPGSEWHASVVNQRDRTCMLTARGHTERRASLRLLRMVCMRTIDLIDAELGR
jgi:hypothetical protein